MKIENVQTIRGTMTFENGVRCEFSAGVVGNAPLQIPHGVAPTAPVNGDVWTTTAGVFARINGVTVGPLGAGGGIVSTDTGILIIGGVIGGPTVPVTVEGEVRGMSTGAYDWATAPGNWQLWVAPALSAGLFRLSVRRRAFGSTAPGAGDSVSSGFDPSITGSGSNITASGSTSGWTSALSVGDMFTVAPTSNGADVRWWCLFIPARRTF